jgi:hypothetical protein
MRGWNRDARSAADRSHRSRGPWIALPVSYQLTRQRPGGLPVAVGDFPGNDRGDIAVRFLKQATSPCRQISVHHRPLHGQAIKVDDVDIGLHAGGEQSAIVQADGASRLQRLLSDEPTQVETAVSPITPPVLEQLLRDGGD